MHMSTLPWLPGLDSTPFHMAPPPPAPPPPAPPQSALIPERVYDDTFQYDVYTMRALPFARGVPVEIILRRVQGGKWVPFLMVAPSAVLQSNGHSGSGLFSLISYAADSETRIGRYTGSVVARFADPESRSAKEAMARYAQEDRQHLLLMRVNDGEDMALVDGVGGSLPKISMVNDARGLHSPDNPHTPMRNNTRFGKDGRGFLYKMPGRAIPAADLAATSLTELWRSELLVSYSSFFWNMQKRLGQKDLPIDLTRTEADESDSVSERDLVDTTSRLSL